MRKSFLASALFGPAALLMAFTATSATYNPVGPQTNVPLATVTDGGWTQCFSQTYAVQNSPPLASIESQCSGTQLMLACRETGSPTIQLLAQAPRADVLFDTGTSNTPHDANGTGWYFSNSYSWGFAALGDTLSRTPCDAATSGNNNARLCWHTSAANMDYGYRCGANTDLNVSTAYEKLIFQASSSAPIAYQAIPTLSEWARITLALLLLGAVGWYGRRRTRQ